MFSILVPSSVMESHLDQSIGRDSSYSSERPSSCLSSRPVSCHSANLTPRPRTASLSRIRDSLLRTGTQIQDAFERHVVDLAEKHLKIPLPGLEGVLFHVPDIPQGHSRESMVNLLHQTVEWLRENPGPGKSPFHHGPMQHFLPETPDLLDFELANTDWPAPTTPRVSSEVCRSTSESNSCDGLTLRHHESDREDVLMKGRFGTVSTDILTDLSSLYPSFSRLSPCTVPRSPDELFLSEQLPEADSPYSDHPRCLSVRSPVLITPQAFHLSRGDFAITSADEGALSNDAVSSELERNQLILHHLVPSRSRSKDLLSYNDTTSLPLRETPLQKPSSTSTCPVYLGAGLRPIPAPVLTTNAAAPTIAMNLAYRKDDHPPLPLSQTSTTRNPLLFGPTKLENLAAHDSRSFLSRMSRLSSSHHRSVHGPERFGSDPPHTRLTSSVGPGHIQRKTKKSLPLLPSEESQRPRANIITVKPGKSRPEGIYGAQAVFQNAPLSQGRSRTTAEESQPKSSSRLKSHRKPLPTSSAMTVSTGRPSPLPPVPHLKKHALLKELKQDLFPYLDGISSGSSTSSTLSPKGSLSLEDKENIPFNDQPRGILPINRPQLPYLPYSRSIVRKGTLSELGGRVVEIQKPSKESMVSTYTLQSSSGDKSQSAKRRAARETPTRPLRRRPRFNSRPRTPDLTSDSDSEQPSPITPTSTRYNTTATNLSRTTKKSVSTMPTSTNLSPTAPYRNYNMTTYRDPDPHPLYTTIHPNEAIDIQADPQSFRSRMSRDTARRLINAADEVDFAAAWRRAMDTGRDSELLRKVEWAFEWKRFSDAEWVDPTVELRPTREGNRRKSGSGNVSGSGSRRETR